jgi:hypothetical protein
MLGFIGLFLTIYIPQVQAQVMWQDNKSRWIVNGLMVNGLSNYTLVVKRGGGLAGGSQQTVVVKNGRLVGPSDNRCADIDCFSSTLFPTNLTVEDLFREAKDCTGFLLSCSAKYNPVYGYPEYIAHSCFDCFFAWTRVLALDFESE